MSFKDQVAADVTGTFLNTDEFATWHTLDDIGMWIVISDNTSNDSPLPYAEAIFVSRITVYVDPIALGYRPEEGQLINIDGVDYRVTQLSDEMGMYVIQMEANAG